MKTVEEILEQARVEREQEQEEKKTTAQNIGAYVGHIIAHLISFFLKAAFIFWGIRILQSKGIAIPDFTYWEVFIMRYALGCIYPNYDFTKK